MKPLIVRITDNLVITNRKADQLIALLQLTANKGDFQGDVNVQLMYVSSLVAKAFNECDVFITHLNDGMRIAFVKDAVNKPGFENPITVQHYKLTFKN